MNVNSGNLRFKLLGRVPIDMYRLHNDEEEYMALRNCWEYKNCGREPRGANSASLGICPATLEKRADGINHGKNGGRACWALTGTLCGGKVQGTFATKLSNCLQCEFYKTVAAEEGIDFSTSKTIVKMLG